MIWALPMTQAEIERGRSRDRQLIDDYFDERPRNPDLTDEGQRKPRSLHDWIFKRLEED